MTDGTLSRQHRFTVLPEHLIRDDRVSDRAMRLWCVLDRYAGADGQAFPSRERLCADLGGISLSSLDRAIRDLCKAGWLRKDRRYKGGPNDYTVLVVPAEAIPDASMRGVSSPVTTGGVVTGDEEKEASSKETSEKETSSLRSEAAAARRGTRLPDDWQPSDALKDWFRSKPELHHVNVLCETENFIDYWHAAPGRSGIKVDWDATWRKWIRTQAERLRTSAQQRSGNRNPQVDGEHAAARNNLF